MANRRFAESTVEQATLEWLEALGYTLLHGPDVALAERLGPGGEPNYREAVLEGRLRAALARLNPGLPREALAEAFRKLTRLEAASLIERNRDAHRMMVNGVTVEYRGPDGRIVGAQARVIDFEAPENNDWLAVNQFTVLDR